MTCIRILLVDDHTVVREGFRGLLALEQDLEVIGEAQNGREAVTAARRLRPDVILMDIAMPLLNGLEATGQILTANPQARVLILSAHGDDAYVDKAFAAGALGFLLKQTSADEVCHAVREITAGRTYLTSALIRHRSRHRPGTRSALHRLTPREVEVLRLIAEGKANKEAAAMLSIGIKTVEKHREHLMAKLGIHDTAGLTRHAIAAGVIESRVQVTIL